MQGKRKVGEDCIRKGFNNTCRVLAFPGGVETSPIIPIKLAPSHPAKIGESQGISTTDGNLDRRSFVSILMQNCTRVSNFPRERVQWNWSRRPWSPSCRAWGGRGRRPRDMLIPARRRGATGIAIVTHTCLSLLQPHSSLIHTILIVIA